MKRVILIVTDSMGVGEAPDAKRFGDVGANTLLHAAENTPGFDVPNLAKLGLMNIKNAGLEKYALADTEIIGAYGKMRELSVGKDTITGHWEIAGIETATPFKTYADGFPKEFMEEFETRIGIKCLGNYPASGTVIID